MTSPDERLGFFQSDRLKNRNDETLCHPASFCFIESSGDALIEKADIVGTRRDWRQFSGLDDLAHWCWCWCWCSFTWHG
ncbi:hypothetical protein [Pseudomonas sp. Ps21-P2]|uniref:hypothetical protein n=1 Tax=Pseudomonas sp. Ps21-P2 TaxID=3080331 RepID=UPI003209B61A